MTPEPKQRFYGIGPEESERIIAMTAREALAVFERTYATATLTAIGHQSALQALKVLSRLVEEKEAALHDVGAYLGGDKDSGAQDAKEKQPEGVRQ